MWLFTPFGFFSIVQYRGDSEALLVRARALADIEEFRSRANRVLTQPPAPIHLPDADYPWRVVLPRWAVAMVVRRFVLVELTYDNFKSEVERRQGAERSHLYEDVWTTVQGITRIEEERIAQHDER